MNEFLRSSAIVIGALTNSLAAADVEYRSLNLVDGRSMEYAFVLPHDYDKTKAYPALLALPPGPQTNEMVEASLNRYWGEQAATRGWIVVSPIAPDGELFYQGAERYIPQLLDAIGDEFKVENDHFHIAGSSNGGRSAFRIATLHPDRFASLTVLPGFPPTEEDEQRLEELRDMPVTMYVGGSDTRWLEASKKTESRLNKLGVRVSLNVLTGEGHVPPSLDGPVIMHHLEQLRSVIVSDRADLESAIAEDTTAINTLLDTLHAAASAADAERYFSCFAPNAVFLGTDATERWTMSEFRAYAMPHFSNGTGWTYERRERHVTISDYGTTAWFDELLHNEKYGECRGTGVLTRIGDEWKIAQYSLSMPVPNDVALDVVEIIEQHNRDAPAR